VDLGVGIGRYWIADLGELVVSPTVGPVEIQEHGMWCC
jgi:hypothetical protein